MKVVPPKLPDEAPLVPGPSCKGSQLRVIVLLIRVKVPADAVPTNTPLALSVMSFISRLKVNALKVEPTEFVHNAHARVKLP